MTDSAGSSGSVRFGLGPLSRARIARTALGLLLCGTVTAFASDSALAQGKAPGGKAATPPPAKPAAPKPAAPTPAKAGPPSAPKAATPANEPAPASSARWTAATPDEMADFGIARAKEGKRDAIAGLLIAAALDDRASHGRVAAGLEAIASSGSPLADDARWLALRHEVAPASTWPGSGKLTYDAPPDPNGLVKAFAVLGPFQDSGGGLARHEGPEAPGQSFADTDARYSWGVYDVGWRRVLPDSATARGVPLDLYIHPRTESCTYLASNVTVPSAGKIMVHVASAGAVRLIWDGTDAATSEDLEPHLVLDRMSVKIDAKAGDHLLAVKVCSGATADDGRVRVRITDEARKPLPLATLSDLRGLASLKGVIENLEHATKGAQPAKTKAQKDIPPKATPHGGHHHRAGGEEDNPTAKLAPSEASGGHGLKKAAGAHAAQPPSRPGITRVPTSLERALAISEDADVVGGLVASITRTLGGGEDSRSPRAPGLLDRVARDPGLSPDELAIAGWVSPFGSNRSGWLNLARTRAAEKGDRATESFAIRRLIAARLASRTSDWALASSREEPFASEKDPEARLLRASVERSFGGAGLGRAGLDDLVALAAELGDKTPIAVTAEVLDAAGADPALERAAADRLAKTKPEARGAGYVSAFRTLGGDALEKAAASVMSQQTSADDVLAIGSILLDAGRYVAAEDAFSYAMAIAPNRPQSFQGFANARQATAALEQRDGTPVHGDPTIPLAAVQRALDLAPGEAQIKAELRYRTESPAAAPSPGRAAGTKMPDEQYIVEPAVFLARAKANPAKKGEIVDRQLHWVRAVTYHPDKRVSQMMHYAREIVIEPRTEDDLFEKQIPAEGDDTELLLARVHRKDGTVALPEEQSAGGRRPFIRWPDLHAGDVVEVAVRSWTAGPVGRRGDSPFYFIDYVGSIDTHPILYNEVVVDSSEASPLAIDVLHPGGPGAANADTAERVVTSKANGRVVTRYIWDHPPEVPDEPLAPNLSESLPVVVGSTYGSWNDFREWYRSAVKGFTEPDEQVKHLAAELTKGKTSRDDKLRALFDFVADDIRYVNYVSGEWWLPNRPQELLARRQGDCDDKAMLLITLLKAVGIEATEVLVQTRYTAEPSLLSSQKAAIPVFDHGIAYLPGKNGAPGTWLDATSPESRLGPLPSMDARTVAMFVDEGAAKIIETPPSAPGEHGTDAEWTITIDPSGAGDLTAKEKSTGDAAFELRCNLQQADARAQWVEQNLASGWFPTVQVKPDVGFKSDLPRGATELTYAAHSDGLARREGEDLAVPISEAQTLTSQLAPLVKRVLPVVLPPRIAPGHQTITFTIVPPAGYAFADLPPGGDENGGEFGKAHLEFDRSKGKNAVTVKRSVEFNLSTIPVDKYAKWRAWLQSVDGLMHRMVRLVPDGKGKAVKVAEAPDAATPKPANVAQAPAAAKPKPTNVAQAPAATKPKPAR